MSIPVSVVIVTKNEASRIGECLTYLENFDDVWVVDSGSDDGTLALAESLGAKVVDYHWNGQYPKKRGWCLENLSLAHEWVFFVDADEYVTPFLVDEIEMLGLSGSTPEAGFFVSGQYVFNGALLYRGLWNKKIALFHRHKMEFPIVDDLDLPGMGEIEGHYQPVLKAGFEDAKIGTLYYPVIHEADADAGAWEARHLRYAAWEAGMNRKGAWPSDPSPLRQRMKRAFRSLPFRGAVAFVHSYILKRGFLDGPAGLAFARSRQRYYRMISEASKAAGKAA